MAIGQYDIAQICLNGHVINSATQKMPHRSQPHCDECGAKTITKCPDCEASIRGSYLSPRRYAQIFDISAPSFCINCGQPFPWTRAKLEAAKEMALEIDGLNDKEKSILAESLDDLVSETPRSALAVTRVKKLLSKVGVDAYEVLRKLLVDITSEAIRKQLWPD